MLRDLLIERGIGEKGGFRWRSHEVSRIEGLSDAVFGFAITLLVVSLDVPRDFTELANRMRGFLAFAISFAMLVWIWFEQHKYFRRYGLQDGVTVTLNVILLFVVLFYVYPLKFLFGLLVTLYSGQAVGMRMPDGGHALGVRDITGGIDPILRSDQWPALMSVYAIGFIAIWIVFVVLTVHAYRRRDILDLNALEIFDTRTKIREYLILVGFWRRVAGSGAQRRMARAGVRMDLRADRAGVRGARVRHGSEAGEAVPGEPAMVAGARRGANGALGRSTAEDDKVSEYRCQRSQQRRAALKFLNSDT